jgi:hypothetical protein
MGDAELTAATIGYWDAHKKRHVQKMKEMKWMLFGNRAWVALPILKNGNRFRLMEILAMDKKHMLTMFWQGSDYLYVFDYNGNMIEDKVYTAAAGGVKKHNRKAMEILSPYFTSCPELIAKFQKNVDEKNLFGLGVQNFKCDGAPDLQEFLSTYKDKRVTED